MTKNIALIIAGGVGSRMGSEIPKQFINVNDKTVEGVHYLGKNVQTVQFHPEACAGPLDTGYLFDEFMNMMEVSK